MLLTDKVRICGCCRYLGKAESSSWWCNIRLWWVTFFGVSYSSIDLKITIKIKAAMKITTSVFSIVDYHNIRSWIFFPHDLATNHHCISAFSACLRHRGTLSRLPARHLLQSDSKPLPSAQILGVLPRRLGCLGRFVFNGRC